MGAEIKTGLSIRALVAPFYRRTLEPARAQQLVLFDSSLRQPERAIYQKANVHKNKLLLKYGVTSCCTPQHRAPDLCPTDWHRSPGPVPTRSPHRWEVTSGPTPWPRPEAQTLLGPPFNPQFNLCSQMVVSLSGERNTTRKQCYRRVAPAL